MVSLKIRCDKVNKPKGSSYIKSPDWLRNENVTINSKTFDDRSFQYAFAFKQHHKEIENHPERVPNIKLFLNLYSWVGIEYLRNVNKRNYALFKKINLEIA